MSRRRSPFRLDVPEETDGRRLVKRFSVRLDRDEDHSLPNRVVRRAQASPYPQGDPIRVPKNRSPPPRSLSRSASTTSEHNPTEVNSSHARSLNNRRSRPRTANRKVHFPPEVDNEQVADPKKNAISNGPVTPESAARTTEISQSGKKSPSRIPDTRPERATLGLTSTAFGSAPTQRFSREEDTDLIEETSSGESEVPEDHTPDTVQSQLRSRREDNIRSGIRDLLEVNSETRIVDANTATILESLLSQMNQDGHDRARENPGPVGPSAIVRTGASNKQREEAPPPMRTVRKFQSAKSEGETVWWESRSGSNLKNPPHNINHVVGDLYIHRNTTDSSTQIWICRESSVWEMVVLDYDDKYVSDRVIFGLSHPSFKDRRLKIRKNGEPSWITKQTCATNKSRRKGEQ